jgi:hypothetical protein
MTPEATNEELSAALIDVRRAYRLLWAFQTRVSDYVKVSYEKLGFVPQWTNSLLTGNTAWAHLPMADMDFRAVRRHKDQEYAPGRGWADFPKAKDTLLFMRIRSDTGLPNLIRGDPNPLTFDPVELCKSKLYLFIVLNRMERDHHSNLWDVSQACRESLDLKKAIEHPKIAGYSIFGDGVDLAALPHEESLCNWLDEFKGAAEAALSINFNDLPGSET